MTDFKLTSDSLTKTFGRRQIFKDLSMEFNSGKVYGISGPNGSGKSTLVKIFSNLIAPTKGKVIHSLEDKIINEDKLHKHVGFVSPYLVLYDEFSAEENIQIATGIRGGEYNQQKVDGLFEKFGLIKRKKDLLKTFSSGMQQRVKLIFAMAHSPGFLILDEPTSNLDTEGKESVYGLVEEASKNSIVIIASNEKDELALCDEIIDLKNYKPEINGIV